MNPTLPTFFVPHGSPFFAVEPGAAGAALTQAAATLPQPRAIVIVSACVFRPIVTGDFGIVTARFGGT